MNIGEAAKQAGVTAKMIRHYEATGLLPEAARTDSGYRQYGEQDIARLGFIRRCRMLGFSIDEIRNLLNLWDDPQRSAREVKTLAQQHLQEVENKIAELRSMQQTLQSMISACSGDDCPQCSILDHLSTPEPRIYGKDKGCSAC
ncbi:MAG: Cu(I)-responsive transcriptional regulator [Oleibacter sp.]|mgnify:FL=1|nr:Cu(I)-responsive transcriptional regulator [Thalassolituus sp.]